MIIFTNAYFFPLLQVMLLVLLLYAMLKDIRWRGWTGEFSATLTVTRSDESMTTLQRVTGLGIAAIITIVNKGVFDSDKQIANYSAIINAFDLAAVVYICYFSVWGRNHIFGMSNRSKTEVR
jgi:SNF family Na+-dependent transporter